MIEVNLLHLATHFVLALLVAWYLITNLQWYNYKIVRVMFYHHKVWWHFAFFLTPILFYYTLREDIYLFLVPYALLFFWWYSRLDKKLVITGRIKRFFAIFLLFLLFEYFVCHIFGANIYSIMIPLALAILLSNGMEYMLFLGFKNQAKRKLSAMSELTIVSITASYGKTSIKNFLHQIIKEHFKTYATPRSVNTIAGILKDINVDLPANTKVYITEAGARERGDIYKIATLLNPQYIIVGKIGAQHMEYFKTIENIILTKLELLATKRLKKGFIYHTIEIKDDERLEKFGKSDREYEQERAKEGKEPAIAFDIRNINATLEGLHFELKVDGTFYPFEAPNLLGAFNAQNIAGAILVARELGLKIEELQARVKLLKPIGHRLQKIEANGKTIIDDSFNGNVDGMMEGFRLASTYQGRKVLVTPGLVESTDEDNTKVAIKADKIFDVVMITGSLNSELFDKNIHNAKKILLKDKAKMQEMLEANTQVGDLILFANDAPNFI